MAWFRRRTAAPPVEEQRSLLPGGLFAPTSLDFMVSNTAGVTVTTNTALQNVAVWACQRVLVSTISMLPVDVVRTVGKIRTPVEPPPPVVRNPSGRVSRRGWVAQCVRSLVGSGNICGRVVAVDSIGRAVQVETIHPDSVTWVTTKDDQVPYINGVEQTLWPLGDFWHVPASQFLMPGSRVAMSPTDFAKTSIGTGIAAERFGASFFSDGLNPSAIVKVDADIDAAQALDIKRAIMNMASGDRSPAVFGSDISSIEPWSASLTDSQFIELLQFEVLQACRVYGVPPSMAYAAISGQNVTYSNISQADLQYLKYSVEAWMIDFEDAWSDLIAIPHSVKFNVEALLRMDAMGRAQLRAVRLANKEMTINEGRAQEDEEPFPDPIFDAPGIPGGQETLGQLMRGLTPAVGVYVTSDEARQLANEAGADLLIPGPDGLGVAPVAPATAPAGRSTVTTEAGHVTIHNVMPEQRDMGAPPITVNVSPTPIENIVNVSPTPVTVENRVETPSVTVLPANVPPADVTVLPGDDSAEITFKRDAKGQIISAKKKPTS